MLLNRLRSQALPLAQRFSAAAPPASWRRQALPLVRRFSAEAAPESSPITIYHKVAAGFVTIGGLQYFLGHKDDYYDFRFMTKKDPADLMEFYGTEEFMEIFCVLPFMVTMMMRFGEFDDEGTVHSYGFPGKMEVSMVFDEEEVDTTGDGEPDTVAYFNKRERFFDISALFPGLVYWDMVQNFGYHRRSDGSCEVYHHGEYFRGFFPMRFFFWVHARYVIWATEKHVNSELFGAESDEGQEAEEEQRAIIPLFVFKRFVHDMTEEVKKAQVHASKKGDTDAEKKHDETLKKLKEIADNDDHSTAVKMSGTGKKQKLQLEIEDKETAAAILEALRSTNVSAGSLRAKEALNTLLTHPEVHS